MSFEKYYLLLDPVSVFTNLIHKSYKTHKREHFVGGLLKCNLLFMQTMPPFSNSLQLSSYMPYYHICKKSNCVHGSPGLVEGAECSIGAQLGTISYGKKPNGAGKCERGT